MDIAQMGIPADEYWKSSELRRTFSCYITKATEYLEDYYKEELARPVNARLAEFARIAKDDSDLTIEAIDKFVSQIEKEDVCEQVDLHLKAALAKTLQP